MADMSAATLPRKYLHAYQLSHINTEPNLHLEQGMEYYVNTEEKAA
jgi:hypothetical protein